MGKHQAPSSNSSLSRRIARSALHPITHIVALVVLHLVAVSIIGLVEESSMLATLLPH